MTSMASVAMPMTSKRGCVRGGHPDLPIGYMGSTTHGRARPMPVERAVIRGRLGWGVHGAGSPMLPINSGAPLNATDGPRCEAGCHARPFNS